MRGCGRARGLLGREGERLEFSLRESEFGVEGQEEV